MKKILLFLVCASALSLNAQMAQSNTETDTTSQNIEYCFNKYHDGTFFTLEFNNNENFDNKFEGKLSKVGTNAEVVILKEKSRKELVNNKLERSLSIVMTEETDPSMEVTYKFVFDKKNGTWIIIRNGMEGLINLTPCTKVE